MTISLLNGTGELYWELTTSCQLACRYCFYETGLSPRQHKRVRPEDARSLMTGDLKQFFESVTFTGGEVLLVPSFWDFVAMAREANLRVSFLTDGLRVDADALKRLHDSGVSRLAISLDSLSQEINDSVRLPVVGATVKGADTIIANIRALARHRPPGLEICVLQTVYSSNIHSIRPMVQFCREINVDLLVHPAGMPIMKSLDDIRLETIREAQVEELQEAMLEWAEGKPGLVGYTHAAIVFIRGEQPSGLICPMGTTTFFIDVAGDVYPCFHRKDLKLGNVWTERLAEILNRARSLDLASAPCAHLACACLLDCRGHVLQPADAGALAAMANNRDQDRRNL